MAKKKQFIDYYRKFCKKGRLVNHKDHFNPLVENYGGGLCSCLPKRLLKTKAFEMMKPYYHKNSDTYVSHGYPVYWGATTCDNTQKQMFELTDVRQNILIFAALLNGEAV